MEKPTLYILCGLPGSGKSTWAWNYTGADDDAYLVSRDDIRFSMLGNDEDYFAHEDKVFEKFVGTITQTLVYGSDVVADATHLNKKSRRKLINAIDRSFSDYQIIFVWFNINVEECVIRNSKREGRAVVPTETIYSMWRNFTIPQESEDKRCIDIWEVA